MQGSQCASTPHAYDKDVACQNSTATTTKTALTQMGHARWLPNNSAMPEPLQEEPLQEGGPAAARTFSLLSSSPLLGSVKSIWAQGRPALLSIFIPAGVMQHVSFSQAKADLRAPETHEKLNHRSLIHT